MKFSVTVPEVKHEALASALEGTGHVTLNGDRRSGTSANSDETKMVFTVKGDQVEVTVTENPRNISQADLKARVTARIAELV